MQPRHCLMVAAVIGGAAVALGAFGAHLLKPHLADRQGYTGDDLVRRLDRFETGVRYQTIHALALAVLGLVASRSAGSAWKVAAGCWMLGIVLFSGLLYALTFLPPAWNWLGAIVPIGGLLLIAGWIALAVAARRLPD